MREIIFNHINNYTGVTPELCIVLLGLIVLYFNYISSQKFFFNSFLITAFVLALFDVFLKKILLFSVDNDYYKFIINNMITIVIIDLLITCMNDHTNQKLTFLTYFNIAFSCFFYETIIFKLYNYNNLCNKRLRNITKTTMRLATIHILSNFLNNKDFNKDWFEFSISQIFNFSLFETAFSEF